MSSIPTPSKLKSNVWRLVGACRIWGSWTRLGFCGVYIIRGGTLPRSETKHDLVSDKVTLVISGSSGGPPAVFMHPERVSRSAMWRGTGGTGPLLPVTMDL